MFPLAFGALRLLLLTLPELCVIGGPVCVGSLSLSCMACSMSSRPSPSMASVSLGDFSGVCSFSISSSEISKGSIAKVP